MRGRDSDLDWGQYKVLLVDNENSLLNVREPVRG